MRVKLGLTVTKGHRLKASKNTVLRILGPKRDEMTVGWKGNAMRKFIICPYPRLIRMIASRRMTLAGQAARKGLQEMRIQQNFISKA
jgi:hypothetical protein